MFPLLAALVALACAGASAVRLWLVVHATALDPELLTTALSRCDASARMSAFREASQREPAAAWERDLALALGEENAELRAALVNEALRELDFAQKRWSRVPRVCASISTSFSLMLATLVLRAGLADAGDTAFEVVVRGLIGDALTVAALGMAGTFFSIAAQRLARDVAGLRARDADQLVELLERSVGDEPRPP